jgi:large subunit ribosomal protein L20
MSRVKRGKVRASKRKNILRRVKGYKWGRKKKIKLAKPALKKAGVHAYFDRKRKKRQNRSLWLIKLNAALRKSNISYSQFIGLLKKQKISLDRKVLSQIAEKYPQLFEKIVKLVK